MVKLKGGFMTNQAYTVDNLNLSYFMDVFMSYKQIAIKTNICHLMTVPHTQVGDDFDDMLNAALNQISSHTTIFGLFLEVEGVRKFLVFGMKKSPYAANDFSCIIFDKSFVSKLVPTQYADAEIETDIGKFLEFIYLSDSVD